MTNPTTTYEGWTNRQTWLANVWLSNEERLYRRAFERVAWQLDRSDTPARIGEGLVYEIMREMQRLLGRGSSAMYDDFCPENGEMVIPDINREELAEHWIAELRDLRQHGEVIEPRRIG